MNKAKTLKKKKNKKKDKKAKVAEALGTSTPAGSPEPLLDFGTPTATQPAGTFYDSTYGNLPELFVSLPALPSFSQDVQSH